MNTNNTTISRVAGKQSLDDILESGGIKASDIIDQVAYNSKLNYHEFTDTTTQTHEYDQDDGYDEQEWFKNNSNYDELIDDLDTDDIRHFRDWTRGRFMRGQQYDGFENMNDYDKECTRTFDKILDESVTDDGIVLSRRSTGELLGYDKYSLPTADQLKRMKGKLILSKANMSTAAAKDGLLIGSSNASKPIEYKIHIPGGAKGAGMWVGDSRISTWGPRQREYMTNRDTVFVVGDTGTKTSTTHDIWTGKPKKFKVQVVHLYYLGRLPHDYGD